MDTDTAGPVCLHYDGATDTVCRSTDLVRVYLQGPRCPDHTPASLAGHPQPGATAYRLTRRAGTTSAMRGGTDANKARRGGYTSKQAAKRLSDANAARRARGEPAVARELVVGGAGPAVHPTAGVGEPLHGGLGDGEVPGGVPVLETDLVFGYWPDGDG